VESDFGKGSTFRFRIRLKIGKTISSDKKTITPQVTKTQKPLHILLVEDDRINQKVIHKMLYEKGHLVTTANDGVEAVTYYENGSYDVVLMDIQMPKMNGIEAMQKIDRLEGGKHQTPMIALSAYALPGDREKFLSLGMDAYLAKPIQMEELYSLLEQVTSDVKSGIPENISLSEDGEVIFNFDRTAGITEQNAPERKELIENIKLLETKEISEDFECIGKIANKIKTISNRIDAIDIKDTAFKIELAARRGNEEEVNNSIEQIRHEFKLYHSCKE
jgi:CheY-like chemotaxis protein